MIQAMRGTLLTDPLLQRIPAPDGSGRVYRGINVKLQFEDSRAGAMPGTCQLIAWNEQADTLSEYKAGDELEFIGRLNSNHIGNHDTLSFTLVSIDETKTIVSAMEQFLLDYEPQKEILTERIFRAELQTNAPAAPGITEPQKEATQ